MKQGNKGDCQLAALVKQLQCKLILHFYVFDTLMEQITLGSVFEFNVLYSIELIIPIFLWKITDIPFRKLLVFYLFPTKSKRYQSK